MRRLSRTAWAMAITLGLLNLALLTPASAKRPGGEGSGGGGPIYSIMPFAPLGANSQRTGVTDVNNVGEVIGFAESSNHEYTNWHLDLTTGTYTQLPFRGDAINNKGEIVTTSNGTAYFIRGLGADPISLPPLAEDDVSVALDINDDRIIVGYSRVAGTPGGNTAVAWRAVVDTQGTVTIKGPVILSPLNGDATSVAVRVNDPVEGPTIVLGDSFGSDIFDEEAVVWSVTVNGAGELQAGQPTGLGNLGIIEQPYQSYSDGYGINGYGDVCGKSDRLPFLSPTGGDMQALPVPRNTSDGYAFDINDSGYIVGYFHINYQKGARLVDQQYPFLWHADIGAIDLNQLHNDNNWDSLWIAYRITNDGVITGYGRYNGLSRGYIMVPNQ